jgi:hypothetical protein
MRFWFSKALFGLLGLALLPALAGLARSAYEVLILLHLNRTASGLLLHFSIGAGIWVVLFLFLGRPLRSYILAHELTHLLAAWMSGVRAGRLRVGAEGGSVEVAKSSWWIALAPYIIPFYTLLVLAIHAVASLRWDPVHWVRALPFVLGVSWSFHITFTVAALLQGQSDLHPYGWLGALPVILLGNLLLILLGLMAIAPLPWTEALPLAGRHLLEAYRQGLHFLHQLPSILSAQKKLQ